MKDTAVRVHAATGVYYERTRDPDRRIGVEGVLGYGGRLKGYDRNWLGHCTSANEVGTTEPLSDAPEDAEIGGRAGGVLNSEVCDVDLGPPPIALHNDIHSVVIDSPDAHNGAFDPRGVHRMVHSRPVDDLADSMVRVGRCICGHVHKGCVDPNILTKGQGFARQTADAEVFSIPGCPTRCRKDAYTLFKTCKEEDRWIVVVEGEREVKKGIDVGQGFSIREGVSTSKGVRVLSEDGGVGKGCSSNHEEKLGWELSGDSVQRWKIVLGRQYSILRCYIATYMLRDLFQQNGACSLAECAYQRTRSTKMIVECSSHRDGCNQTFSHNITFYAIYSYKCTI